MNTGIDSRPWITIFPDYPRAFAWFLPPCNESKLNSYVGSCCGDLFSKDNQGFFRDEQLPTWLTMRFCAWMDKWEEYERRGRMSDLENSILENSIKGEERAINDEGIELTRELKKLYGDKYRFRYSFAWRYGPKDWVVV